MALWSPLGAGLIIRAGGRPGRYLPGASRLASLARDVFRPLRGLPCGTGPWLPTLLRFDGRGHGWLTSAPDRVQARQADSYGGEGLRRQPQGHECDPSREHHDEGDEVQDAGPVEWGRAAHRIRNPLGSDCGDQPSFLVPSRATISQFYLRKYDTCRENENRYGVPTPRRRSAWPRLRQLARKPWTRWCCYCEMCVNSRASQSRMSTNFSESVVS